MRRTLAVVAVTMILSSAVSAASTPATQLGLYVDDAHLQNCVPFTVSIGHYTVWSWCSSNDDGVQAASFAVLYDGSGLVRGPVQVNTDIIDH